MYAYSRDTHENYMTLDIHNAMKNSKCEIMQNTDNVFKILLTQEHLFGQAKYPSS